MKKFILIISCLVSEFATAQFNFSLCSYPIGTDTWGIFSTADSSNGLYFNNQNCTLLIQPPCADSIFLTFAKFSTELNHDFLSVYDGTTTAAPLLLNHSGNSMPVNVIGVSGSLLIVWHSDSLINDTGFIGYWSVISNHSPLNQFSCYPYARMPCCEIGFSHIKINPVGNSGIGIDNYSGISAYTDYSCDSMTIYTNSDYDFSATYGLAYRQQMSAWIDFDNNGVFDPANERIINMPDTIFSYNSTFHIDSNNIPLNVFGQPIRLRVMSDYSGNPPISPCINPIFGEVEDYSVIIQKPIINTLDDIQQEIFFNIFPNPSGQNSSIEYDLNINSIISLDIFDPLGNRIFSFAKDEFQLSGKHFYNFNNISTGIYFVEFTLNGRRLMKKLIRL